MFSQATNSTKLKENIRTNIEVCIRIGHRNGKAKRCDIEWDCTEA